ncbi:branched-chain amino acid ABC transporter permease [Deinococcus ruber]|uniref:Branched-chain amino acid ABC transporter permease n=1 Tax=Deinococcus ruber TaxID=1848197 RepID=A0A918F0V5_9DEIO|nr:branched-chain amino acid ABC transporter permease [Deinococcus ruber]GGQ97134.1 branched-chain amino acid ABC transporter permease [Deinococcus ruber]
MSLPTPRATLKGWPWLLVFVLAALVPLLVGKNGYVYDVAINVMIFAIAAYGMNVMLGYAGLLPLAHAGFFGIGAYTVGILMLKVGWSFWLAWPIAVAVCAVLGLLLGLVAFRTRDDVFAIFTLGVGVIITQVINKWDALTGGNDGLNGISAPKLGSIDFGKSASFYYLALLALAVTIFLVARVRSSLFGRSLIAIRGGEDLARSAGINVYTHKLRVMMLSTALAGFAGGLYAIYVGFLGAAITGPVTTFTILLYLLVGGVGTLAGPLLGTLIIRVLQQFMQGLADYQYVVFGPMLVLLVLFFPAGLTGLWARLRPPKAPVLKEISDAGV